MSDSDKHIAMMRLALQEGKTAYALNEVPIGAVLTHNDQVVSKAHNMRETWHDPTAHAEMIVLRQAAKFLNSWRLTECTLYVTIEPCPMCAGALLQARIPHLIYGASDNKAGAVDTLYNLASDDRLNHQMQVTSGVLEDECRQLMQQFFRRLRT